MPTQLAALIYAVFSLTIARAICWRNNQPALSNRIVLTWIMLAPLAFFVPPSFLPLGLAALILFLLKPRTPSDAILYFIAVLPAMPDFYTYEVPFPGLNYLIELSHVKVAILIVALPCLFTANDRQVRRDRINSIDAFVVIFSVYVAAMSLRDAPVTTMLREFVDQMIVVLIPYFAISRTVVSRDHIERALEILLLLAVVLTCVGLVSTVLRWDFYRFFDLLLVTPEFRNGLLRINLTMNTASVCALLSLGMVVLMYLRSCPEKRVGSVGLLTLGTMFGFVVFATGNRGGLLQVIISPILFWMLMYLGRGTQRLLIWATGTMLITASVTFQTIDWGQFDELGTFQFRADLIDASMVQFGDAPLFGTHDYETSGHFDHLKQYETFSEGFVDVANWYLQILLEFGTIGFVCFLFPYLRVVQLLHREANKREIDTTLSTQSITLLAMLVPYLVVIGTTSNVALLPFVGVILLGLGRSVLSIAKTRRGSDI